MKKTITQLYLIRMHKVIYVLMACVQFCFLQSAYAQTDTTKKLKEVQVNSKTPLKQQTVIPTQRVSATEFKRYGALNVADALVGFAGVNLKDYGGIGGLKTISVRSLGANHTGVLYDGIQLNDAQNGQIDLGRFSLYNISEIALYNGQVPHIVQPARSFASASILDIITKKPELNAAKPYQVTAGVAGGSFGLINPYLQWQQRISSNWSFTLNGSYTGANGRYKYKIIGDGSDTLATRHNSDVKSYQTDGALYWAKNDSNKFKLQFNYNNSNRGLPGPVIFYTDNSKQQLQNHDLLIQSGYEHIASNSFHLLISSKFSQNYLHYADPDFKNNTGGIDEHYTQHEFYQSIAVGYHLLPNWEVSYATDAALANLQSDVYQYAFPTRVSLLNVLATNFTFGKWQLQGNILHNYITESVKTGTAAVNRSAFSPTIAASFKPFDNSGFLLRAFYKNSFRAPTFAEQYYYATVPRSIRPEYVKQYNLGITYGKSFDALLNDVTLTADAYYNNVKDKIIYLPTRSPETPSVTNLGKVDIKGLDVTLKTRWLLSPSFTGVLSAAYTYQNAINVTNPADSYYLDQIPYTPKNLINLNGGLTYKQLNFYYNYQLSSSRYYISNNEPDYYLPGYHASNASLVYNFLSHKMPVTVSAEVNNIFNLNYVIIRNYPMPGRAFRLSMQITI
jgi:vitamin B12 transporter